MNEPCTRFQTNLSRVTNNLSGWDRSINNTLSYQTTRALYENRQDEALFAEALKQVERARESSGKLLLLDWEDFEKNSLLNRGLSRALSSYRVKILTSAIASYQRIYDTRLQRQIRTVIARLTREPRPSHSLELPLGDEKSNWQARKIQLDFWWILYAVDEEKQEAIVIEIVSDNSDGSNLASQRNLVFSDWAYHYC